MNGSPESHITVRFEEVERYDPVLDEERLQLMAITNIGTYYADVPLYGAVSKRRNRERFHLRVMETIESGAMPGEIEMRDH